MRPLILFPMLLAACASPKPSSTPAADDRPSHVGGIRTYDDVERYSGGVVTVEGRFDHIRGEHGIVVLPSDLRIYIPHFDLFKRNDDWFKYVGRRVRVTGRLHTYTKDIPGYHGPSIEIMNFQGPLD